jgi:hypothetical protein
MATKAKAISISTLKSVAACHAVGLTYFGGAGSLLVAVDDRQFYHWVRVRTSKGTTSAAHACQSRRTAQATDLTHTSQRAGQAARFAPHRETEFSREATRLELALVCPSWICDTDDTFVEVPSTDNIMTIAGIEVSDV